MTKKKRNGGKQDGPRADSEVTVITEPWNPESARGRFRWKVAEAADPQVCFRIVVDLKQEKGSKD